VGWYKEDIAGLFTVVSSEQTIGNRHKQKMRPSMHTEDFIYEYKDISVHKNSLFFE